MTSLVFPGNSYAQLSAKLLGSKDETCAILLCGRATNGSVEKLLVREQFLTPGDAYRGRSPVFAQLKPEFLVEISGVARRQENSMVFVHTHPGFLGVPEFSAIDDDGEKHLAEFLAKRIPGKPHAALVIGHDGCAARMLNTKRIVNVVEVGPEVRFLSGEKSHLSAHSSSVYDRQLRAFGTEGQKAIENLNIAIVGLGGTGSVVAEQLAHLGAKHFVLVDPDVVEETNLNRLVGAKFADVGKPKTEVAAHLIRGVQSSAEVRAEVDSVLKTSAALRLRNVDFLFSCTDSHGSRAVLNQLAYQYLIPCIDLGVTITAHDLEISHIFGRVQMLAPGLGCLVCGGILNSEEIRRDLLSDFERKADPYIHGAHEPQPAVISLNSTVASLAVTMFLSAVAGIPSKARFQLYNAISGNLRGVVNPPNPVCVVCSSNGALARGDEWPLPTRP